MLFVDEEKLFIGGAVSFYDLFMIRQPTVKDIISLGKIRYNYYVNLLTMSETDIMEVEKTQEIIAPLKYLIQKCQDNDTFLLELKTALSTFIMVEEDEIRVLTEMGMIQVGKNLRAVLNENNFLDFQNVIRLFNNLPRPELPPANETPIQKKFRLNREKVERQKKKQMQKSGDGIDFLDILSSLIVGQVIQYKDIDTLPIYTFHSLFERYQAKLTYEMDIDALLAGADSKKIKPRHWFLKNKK